jgi:hypothetical protein
MNKTYKLVVVYCGYGEMGIESVEIVKGKSREEVLKKRLKELKEEYKKEEGEEFDVKSFNEWNGLMDDGCGLFVGEENVELCFEEGEEMFDFIKGDCYSVDYSDEEWKKWEEFMEKKW